ncbi:MAG: HD domain-containing protein, partial [Zetaproteobacteria bacterium]
MGRAGFFSPGPRPARGALRRKPWAARPGGRARPTWGVLATRLGTSRASDSTRSQGRHRSDVHAAAKEIAQAPPKFSLDSRMSCGRVRRSIPRLGRIGPPGAAQSERRTIAERGRLRASRDVGSAGRRPPTEEGGTISRPSDLPRNPARGTPSASPEASLSIGEVGSTQGDGRRPVTGATPEPVDRLDAVSFALAKRELDRILESAAAGQAFVLDELQGIVGNMAKSVASGDALLVQALSDDRTTYDLSHHMVNTAIFAIKIGQGGGCRAEELPWLGLAACLHDVGMSTVPRPILEKPGPLTADETTLVRRHPESGFRILQRLGSEFEWLANVALQEHEREDGSGYPRGLKGNEIHEYAKIVGLADAYESLTHFRPHRNKRGAFDAVKELITVQRAKFP